MREGKYGYIDMIYKLGKKTFSKNMSKAKCHLDIGITYIYRYRKYEIYKNHIL